MGFISEVRSPDYNRTRESPLMKDFLKTKKRSFSIVALSNENIQWADNSKVVQPYHKPSDEILDWLELNNIEYMLESPWPNWCGLFMFRMTIEQRIQFKLTFSLNAEYHPSKPTIWNAFGLYEE